MLDVPIKVLLAKDGTCIRSRKSKAVHGVSPGTVCQRTASIWPAKGNSLFNSHAQVQRMRLAGDEEVENVYEPSVVEAKINDEGDVEVTTSNGWRCESFGTWAQTRSLTGRLWECRQAADGFASGCVLRQGKCVLGSPHYDDSRSFSDNRELRKRPDCRGRLDMRS